MIPLVNPAIARQSSAAAQPWLRGAVRWIVVALALVATADAAYLTWTSFTHGVVAGCDGLGHGGCDDVLTSRWSRAAGLPVALGGLAVYGTILVLGLMAGTRSFNESRALGTVLAGAALLAAFSGLWFTGLQIFTLGAYCYYCLGIHLCGLVMAILVLWSALGNRPVQSGASRSHASLSRTHASMAAIPGARRTAGPRPAERPSILAAAPVAGVLLALLIAAQVMFPPKTFDVSKPELAATIDMTATGDASVGDTEGLSPDAQSHVVNRPTDEAPEDEDESTADRSVEDPEAFAADDDSPAERSPKLSREVTFLKDRIKLDMYKEAVLGSPEAKYVVVELMDYTCPHCRKMHAHIREAMSRYGDQLAVVILPVPLELECNKMVAVTDPAHRGACKIARTALAVGEVAPSKFLDFHNFLLANEEKVPSAGQAVVRGYQIVDRKRLKTRGASQEIEDRIQKDIRLYSALAAEHRGDTTFGLPVQIVGDTVLSGGEVTAEEMFEAWEKALGIKPL